MPFEPAADVPSWMDGGPTLWQRVPAPTQAPATATLSAVTATAPAIDEQRFSRLEQAIESKLERMFAKLEEIDKTRKEANHIEIILFILGGLFLLLMLDMLVKQGTKATMFIAAAGGHFASAASLHAAPMALYK